MNLLTKIFGTAESTQTDSGATRNPPPQGIGYDGGLVRDLVADHHKLVSYRNRIEAALSAEDVRAIPGILSEWKLALQTHVMVENVRFYTYLQQHLSGDPDVSAFLSDLRHEMDGIARALIKFANAYSSVEAMHRASTARFREDLAEMSARLGKRLQAEESRLYTLYIRY